MNNKNITIILSAIIFPMIWWLLAIIGSTIALSITPNKNTLAGAYNQNFRTVFIVYMVASFILAMFGAWFAKRYHKEK